MKVFLLLVISYLIGSIPTGVVVSRFLGKDPRKGGSRNIGATNVVRTVGKGAGLITLIGDMAKGGIPVLAALKIYGDPMVVSLAALSAFLGHLYPLFLGFKGGKGVATGAGVFLVISPLSFLLGVLVFGAVAFKTRYVSLASLSAAGTMPLFVGLFAPSRLYLVLAILLFLFILYRHRENIQRLIEGREHQISL